MENTIVISLVLYKTVFSEMPNYTVLKHQVLNTRKIFLFIYDNSPLAQEDDLFNETNVVYIHNPLNPGLAKAYNEARTFMLKVEGDLLLLLDQDTLITEEYLVELSSVDSSKFAGAYVPIIISHGKQVSPVLTDRYVSGRSTYPPAGIYPSLMAINSGTAIPKNSLESLGEFNQEFPLDFLDHWLFFELANQKKEIHVLDFRLEHDLSILNYSEVSFERYESIITAESHFYKKYDRTKLAMHKKQLILRTIKQFLFVRNRKIWRRTLSEFMSQMRGK